MNDTPRRDLEPVPGLPLDEGRTHVRWALAFAVVAHAGLFVIDFPELTAAQSEPREPEVCELRVVPYRATMPKPEELIPRERARRVPVPDPTPEDPEPLWTPPIEPVDLPLPTGALDIGFPEPPPALEETSNGPYVVGGEVTAPVRLFAPEPRYTEIARKVRVQGRVIVEAIIDETGRVVETKVVKSLPMGLDQAAVDAISQWRFEPGTLRGKPVPVRYNLTINFRLR